MADPRNLKANGNSNNSTADERVIWEDGQWAIIEAGDCWDGLSRSKTRDTLGDAHSAPWDPGMTTMPGPNSVRAKKLVKVRLADLLAHPAGPRVQGPPGVKPTPGQFKAPQAAAPPSPFMPKPWKAKDIPPYPYRCHACGGWFYQGLTKTVHESTEHDPVLQGACPGSPEQRAKEAREAAKSAAAMNKPHQRWP